MDVLGTLIAAKALIADEARWCQFTREDDDGRLCSMGALNKVCGDEYYLAAIHALKDQIGRDRSVADYNDTHTHAEVMAMWDRAIAAERAKRGVDELRQVAAQAKTEPLSA